MKTTTKTFKWYLSGKAAKLRKRLNEIKIMFFKMIEDDRTRINY
jgi:hypothetical protein